MLDPQHPFFRPAWRRYLITAAPFAWAFVEYGNGNPLWAYLFAGIGGYLGWQLILSWKPDGED
ncbi:MAG: hypothetical protein AAGA38_04035 [Pseudomonadota bacterium]